MGVRIHIFIHHQFLSLKFFIIVLPQMADTYYSIDSEQMAASTY